MKWLHLSDIHFNPRRDSYYTLSARKNLPTFLATESITANHMFVTGDYRHAYKQRNQPEEEVASSAVDYILEVANKAGIPFSNIHIVPGNHDLKRFDKTTESESIEKLETLRQKYIDDQEKFLEEDLCFLNEPFRFFRKVCEELKKRVPNISIPWDADGIMPPVVSECFDEFSLLYLNTCLFCHSDDARNANLLVDTASIFHELEKIEEKNKETPIIILAHHEMGALEISNKKVLEDILHNIQNPLLYLCGDTHETWVRTVNKILEITVGCLLEARSVKTMIAAGECSHNGFNSIVGYSCERGRWGTYPQFNLEVLEHAGNLINPSALNMAEIKDHADRVRSNSSIIDPNNVVNPLLTTAINNAKKDPVAYFKAWAQPYGLLVTDITGVLFNTNENGKEEFPDEIIGALARLAKRHISVCFTTGRGRAGARHLLLNLAQKIVETDSTLSWESLSGDWACITHNGAYLLTTPDKSRSGFLANEEPLCPEKHEYIEFHVKPNEQTLRNRYKKVIENICKREKKVDSSTIIYDLSIEPVSIRFSLEHCNLNTCEQIFSATKKFCESLLQKGTNYVWYATRGKYEQKEMFEYSLVNKSDAVKDYIKRYRAIDVSNIIRIADTGQPGGSDNSFLTDGPSFSVKEITTQKKDTCFPVVNWETNEVLFNTEATVYLLERLHFYPSLCVKSVADPKQYRISFAKAISGARKRSEDIFSFYNTRLAWMDFLYEDNYSSSNITRVFDVKSGAITFSDYEWSKIEMLIEETENYTPEFEQVRCFAPIITSKTMGENSSISNPSLTFFLHTDTHVIFRGSLYYAFFIRSITNPDGTDCITIRQWIETYQKWFKEAQRFIDLFKNGLNGLSLTKEASTPIGYLARKLIIGGLDNLRNVLLILDYFYLRQYVINKNYTENDFLVEIGNSTDELLEQCDTASSILSDCLSSMYTAIFESQIDICFINKLLSGWITALESFMKKRENDYEYLFSIHKSPVLKLFPATVDALDSVNCYFSETFQRWRESDCFIENVSAIEIYLSKVTDGDKQLVFWGIPYGSLEHPILASLLCSKHGLNASLYPHYIMLHGKYEGRHLNEFELSVPIPQIYSKPYTDEVKNVLIDDTLTTAKTLDLGAKCLSLHNIALNDIIVMRYAGLNRLNHYLTNLISSNNMLLNASAPDITKFFDVITGLVAEAPYSKLYKYGSSLNENKPYEDVLGVFDKSKNRIKNYLITNYGLLSRSN